MNSPAIVLRPACVKTLSVVEARPERSNQHEFNGVRQLKDIFGLSGFSEPAIFSIRGTSISVTANVTWYDAREDHATRTEYRLYFQTNGVMEHANEGDNIVIGFDDTRKLHIILIPRDAVGFQPNIAAWEEI